jgi:hypothetical protein
VTLQKFRQKLGFQFYEQIRVSEKLGDVHQKFLEELREFSPISS